VRLDQVTADHEAESGAHGPDRLRGLPLAEPFEEERHLARGDPRTRVHHCRLDRVGIGRQRHGHRPTGRRELERVPNEVHEHLIEPMGISPERHPLRVSALERQPDALLLNSPGIPVVTRPVEVARPN